MLRIAGVTLALVGAALTVRDIVSPDKGTVVGGTSQFPAMLVSEGADPADDITWRFTARLAPQGWCDEMRFVLPDEVSAPGGCGADLKPGETITWGVLQAGNSAQYTRGYVSKDVAKVVIVLQGGEKVEPELVDPPKVFESLSFHKMFFQPVDIRITITDVYTYDANGKELEHQPGVPVMKM